MTKRTLASSLAIVAMLLAGGESLAAQCSAESGARRVPLLELYTSEGCDSCPPTDRWMSGLPGRGLTAGRVVTLAFHVDYWNTLGWADPFAKAEYSARQRTASQRNKARFVYTPQLILDGRDYRRGSFRDDFADRVSAVNQEPARAKISLELERRRAEQVPGLAGCDPGGAQATDATTGVTCHFPLRGRAAEAKDALSVHGKVSVPDTAQRRGAQAFLALYENNLSNQVTAGENRGKRLQHDFVVRELSGPHATDSQGEIALSHRFKLDPRWKSADLHIAAFVQNERTGEVLQALAVSNCR
jgi:hypothetical protein